MKNSTPRQIAQMPSFTGNVVSLADWRERRANTQLEHLRRRLREMVKATIPIAEQIADLELREGVA